MGPAEDAMSDKWDPRGELAAAAAPRDEAAAGPDPGDVEELQRLMRGFAGELRKLEEGLRILSAYVTRMRHRSESGEERTLH
jgi:hypothetical protein